MHSDRKRKIQKFFYDLKMLSLFFVPLFSFIAIMMGGLVYIAYNENMAKTPIEPQIFVIEGVREHEPGHYSIIYTSTINTLETLDLLCCVKLGTMALTTDDKIKLIPDVAEGKPMWVKINQAMSPNGNIIQTKGTEIHIHSAREINGGGWNHGKFGSGQTNVIE